MKRDSVSVYVHMRRDTPSPLPMYADAGATLPSPHKLRTYLLDGLFLNQKAYKNIWISYSLKYTHSEKYISLRKINGGVGWNKHSGEQH